LKAQKSNSPLTIITNTIQSHKTDRPTITNYNIPSPFKVDSSADSNPTSNNMTMMFEIIHPAETDVLCGKDKTFAKHPGNVLYRNLIQAFSQVYAETPTKQEKMRMTAEIVHKMKVDHGSRFLKSVNGNNNSDWGSEDGSGGTWEEISVTAARDKTSHALRFCAANQHHTSYASGAALSTSSSSTNTPAVTPAPPRRSM
jgi:hypothetical protein